MLFFTYLLLILMEFSLFILHHLGIVYCSDAHYCLPYLITINLLRTVEKDSDKH